MLSSYFLEVRTGAYYDAAAYQEAANRLAVCTSAILNDTPSLNTLTHSAPRTECTSEMEIMMDEHELVMRALVDITAPDRVTFDKGKFSKMVRSKLEIDEWPKLKVSKKAVPDRYMSSSSMASSSEPMP